MKKVKIVVDTNVLVAALRSRHGASFKLLEMIDDERLEVSISVPLFLEYESAAKRLKGKAGLSISDIDAILDYIAAISQKRKIYYLWRPFLKDPKDDMVLELAVAVKCHAIVTYNKKDFDGSDKFGVDLLTPKELLMKLGEIS